MALFRAARLGSFKIERVVSRMHEYRHGAKSALLLDALGTLIRLEPPAPRLRRALAERCGVEISEHEAARAIAAEISYYRANLGYARDAVRLAELRRRCAATIRDALPARVGAPDLAALLDALLASLVFRAFDDVRPALESARARGLRLVIVSNWDISLREVLARLGLAPLVDGVAISAEIGAAKPSAEIFERALTIAGCSAAQALHVGDSVTDDVQGALRAGIEPVLLARDGGTGPAGVRTIASLSELGRLLEQ